MGFGILARSRARKVSRTSSSRSSTSRMTHFSGERALMPLGHNLKKGFFVWGKDPIAGKAEVRRQRAEVRGQMGRESKYSVFSIQGNDSSREHLGNGLP